MLSLGILALPFALLIENDFFFLGGGGGGGLVDVYQEALSGGACILNYSRVVLTNYHWKKNGRNCNVNMY